MSDRRNDSISIEQLEQGVARGIITAEQMRALQALDAGEIPEGPAEARRGLNSVTVAYGLGGAAVVFAFGWFVVDRWEVLGPAGVLAVSALYALIFSYTSRYLGRLGFHTAASIAALVAVATAPLVAWSLLHLAGWWYEPPPYTGSPYITHIDVLEQLRWLPLELATALAALVALRRVRFGLLALPVAAVLPLIVNHLVPLVVDYAVASEMMGWGAFVSAVVLIAAGHAVEQHPRDDEDYARWVYLAGLVTLGFSVIAVWSWAGALRHALPALAVALFALSLLLRRPMFAVFGALGFVGYLAYLAFDVFRTTLSFPIVLATFGIGVIVITVWLQRRYPALARRVEHRRSGQRSVPHAGLVFGGAIAVALALAASRIPGARERAANTWMRERRSALQMHRLRQRQHADSAALHVQPAGKTPPAPRP
jgi:hypothetical protein